VPDPFLSDADLTRILGPKCPDCGWRRGQHRPAAPGMGMTACPQETPMEEHRG
jgi:hypothetical protein